MTEAAVSRVTSKWAVAANTLTLSRIAFAPIVAFMVLQKNPWWLTFWLGWVLGATDKLDGSLARQAEPTRTGAFLDTLADKVIVLFIGYALVIVGSFSWIPMTIIAVREIGMMGYRSYWSKYGLAMPARKSGKYKTFAQGIALSAGLFPPLENYPKVDDGLLWFAVVLTLFSAAQYIIDGRSALSSTGERS